MKLSYLVDTDWAIHYLNGHAEIARRLDELHKDGLGLSVISLAELFEGVFYSTNPERNEQQLMGFLRGVTVIGIDEDTCKLFGKERGRLRASQKLVGDFDLLIGMTARQHGLTLLTNNRRHFELVEGLKIQST
ncbi:MAG: type II toxin-antitoxin system VapC family toxin [Acidobacteria bacterium]|nr:type II toxin-antitoxin system VapC family toxin [Acidobacteriota bacterium]